MRLFSASFRLKKGSGSRFCGDEGTLNPLEPRSGRSPRGSPRSERSTPGFNCTLTGGVRIPPPPSEGGFADTLPRFFCFFFFFYRSMIPFETPCSHKKNNQEMWERGGEAARRRWELRGTTVTRRIPAFLSLFFSSFPCSERGDAQHKAARRAAWKFPPVQARGKRRRARSGSAAGGKTLPADGIPGSECPITECSVVPIVRR